MDPSAKRHEQGVTSALALALLSAALLLSMSVWLSASAVLPALTSVWRVSGAAGWLSASVQIGFSAGALTSALLGLADRVAPRRMFMLASFAAALCNAAFAIWGGDLAAGLVLRLLTGAALAAVYPVAVKLLAEWFPTSRGVAMGIMIAGLTLGSALPHLLHGGVGALAPWQVVVGSCSALAVAGGLIVWLFLPDSPGTATTHGFRWDALPHVVRNRPVVLATLGYFGHNWELYGMWVWLPAFLYQSWSHYTAAGRLAGDSEFAAFVVIGVAGAVGALVGGRIADQYGRARTILVAMTASGLCALAIGWTFPGPPWVTLAVALLWGIAVIADSAQFSAAVTELSDPAWVGTALTFQLSAGFLVTVISINVVPWLQVLGGWRWAFSILSLGPAVGILAMARLQREPRPAGRISAS